MDFYCFTCGGQHRNEIPESTGARREMSLGHLLQELSLLVLSDVHRLWGTLATTPGESSGAPLQLPPYHGTTAPVCCGQPSSSGPTSRLTVKNLGFDLGFEPCWRVLPGDRIFMLYNTTDKKWNENIKRRVKGHYPFTIHHG